MASLARIGSHTSAGIIFRTVLVLTAWSASERIADLSIYLFAPKFFPIYGSSIALIALNRTVVRLLVFWAIVLLPEKRHWSSVGWTREMVTRSLFGGSLIGGGVYLLYVGVVDACGWYRIIGHYAWSHISKATLVSLLNAFGWEPLFWGYLLKGLEKLQGTGRAFTLAAVIYSSPIFIYDFLQTAFDHHPLLPVDAHFAQGVILNGAIGLFYGAVYLWRQRLWLVVAVSWGMRFMDFLWTNDDPDQSALAVFRFSLAPHSFDLTGSVFVTKVTIFVTAGIVMALLAKRRGHWRERVTSEVQP